MPANGQLSDSVTPGIASNTNGAIFLCEASAAALAGDTCATSGCKSPGASSSAGAAGAGGGPTVDTSSMSPNEKFKHLIDSKTEEIHNKLTQGKSLTKNNKNDILQLLKEIQQSTNIFCGSSEASNTFQQPCSAPALLDRATVSIIKDVVREEVSKLQTSIENMQKPSSPTSTPTYANMASAPPRTKEPKPIPVTKPAIIVSAKDKVTSSEETKKIWRQSVSFRETDFSPAAVKYVSKNKIRVEFDSPEQRDATIQKLSQPDCKVDVEIARKLKPMILLKGISQDIPAEELSGIIRHQNSTISDLNPSSEDIEFKFKRGNRNTKLYNAAFVVTPAIWRSIIDAKRLNIDHQRIHAEDYSPLLQCYQCLQFGHTRSKCLTDDMACSHCASLEHCYKNCPHKKDNNYTKCLNCEDFNKKHKITDKSTKHSATSIECPRVKHMLEKTRDRTDYGY